MDQTLFGPDILWTDFWIQNFFVTQDFFDLTLFFVAQNFFSFKFLWTKDFLEQKLFWTQNFFDPIYCIQTFLDLEFAESITDQEI